MQRKFLNVGDCVAIGNARDGLDSWNARQAYIISLTGQSYEYYDGRVDFQKLEDGKDIFVMVKGEYDRESGKWYPGKITSQCIIAPWADYAAHQAVKTQEREASAAVSKAKEIEKEQEWDLMLALLIDLNIDYAPTNQKYYRYHVDGLTPTKFIEILKRVKGNARAEG